MPYTISCPRTSLLLFGKLSRYCTHAAFHDVVQPRGTLPTCQSVVRANTAPCAILSLKLPMTLEEAYYNANLAAACIVVTASMIRGPLYQRASTVNSNVLTDINGTTTVTIAQQLPDGYTGHSTYSRAPVRETSSLTGNFTEISKEYTARTTIILPHSYCGNACDATVTVRFMHPYPIKRRS